MNTNQKFAIFCARKCLHLWQAPRKVIEWLNNPRVNTAYEASDCANAAYYSTDERNIAGDAAAYTTFVAAEALIYTTDDIAVVEAMEWAADALGISDDVLKQEFVSTWSDEELSTTVSYWVGFATLEILNREAKKQGPP